MPRIAQARGHITGIEHGVVINGIHDMVAGSRSWRPLVEIETPRGGWYLLRYEAIEDERALMVLALIASRET